jgi:hypothetical protein
VLLEHGEGRPPRRRARHGREVGLERPQRILHARDESGWSSRRNRRIGMGHDRSPFLESAKGSRTARLMRVINVWR